MPHPGDVTVRGQVKSLKTTELLNAQPFRNRETLLADCLELPDSELPTFHHVKLFSFA